MITIPSLVMFILAILSVMLVSVSGFGTGAPSGACQDMRPGPPHGDNQAEGTKPPFDLVAKPLGNKQVKGETSRIVKASLNLILPVFLKTTTAEQKFRGLLVMAEVDGDRGHGYFIPALDSKDLVQSLDCKGLPSSCPEPDTCKGTANAVTHKNNEDKTSVTLIWTPPSKTRGRVVFVATLVGENSSDRSSWWEGVRSNTVKI